MHTHVHGHTHIPKFLFRDHKSLLHMVDECRRRRGGKTTHFSAEKKEMKANIKKCGRKSKNKEREPTSMLFFFFKNQQALPWEILDPNRRLHIKENVENYRLDLCATLDCWF